MPFSIKPFGVLACSGGVDLQDSATSRNNDEIVTRKIAKSQYDAMFLVARTVLSQLRKI